MLKLCNALYWLALSIWVGALIAVGVAAFFAFTTLRTEPLGLHLGAFAEYDPEQHWRIAAGHVTEPIFTFADVVQVPAALVVIATLAAQLTVFRMNWRTPANLIRTIAIVVAAALFVGRVVFLMPQMNADLRGYRDAAKAGEIETAERRLAAFTVNHHRARPMMDWSLVLLLIAVVASGTAMTSASKAKPSSALQTPKLSRKT